MATSKDRPKKGGQHHQQHRHSQPHQHSQHQHRPKHQKDETSSEQTNKSERHNFATDPTDHCESPLQAYQDAVVLLDFIAKALGKDRSGLAVYDPYYCDGGVKRKLASLGFTNVWNENRDFYDDIATGSVPKHDVVVTNPPYSGQHMERLLTFCRQNRKPFLLLLPHFVYTKDYYGRALRGNDCRSKDVAGRKHDLFEKVFFVVPRARYLYTPPSWVDITRGSTALSKGKSQTAPFPTFWYCFIPAASDGWLQKTFGPSGKFDPTKSLHYARTTDDIPREAKGEFDSSKKRPNPKARKRAAAKRRRLQGAGL